MVKLKNEKKSEKVYFMSCNGLCHVLTFWYRFSHKIEFKKSLVQNREFLSTYGISSISLLMNQQHGHGLMHGAKAKQMPRV